MTLAGGTPPGVSPDGDGLGHGVDVVGLVLGALVHGACEGVQPAVLVRVLGVRGHRDLGGTRVDLGASKTPITTSSQRLRAPTQTE